MKIRKRRLFVILFILSIGAVPLFFWQHIRLNRTLTNFVTYEAEKALNSPVYIEDIDIGLGHITIEQARISRLGGSHYLTIPQIIIFYSLSDLFQMIWQQKPAFQSLVIKSPEFHLNLNRVNKKSDVPPGNGSESQTDAARALSEVMKRLPAGRIILMNGVLIQTDMSDGKRERIDNIQLTADTRYRSNIHLRMRANYRSNHPNIRLMTGGDVGDLLTIVDIQGIPLTYLPLGLLTDDAVISDGVFSATGRLRVYDSDQGIGFDYLASLSLKNGTVESAHPHVILNHINCDAVIENNVISLEKLSLSVKDARVDVRGEFDLKERHIRSAQFHIDQLRPDRFFAELGLLEYDQVDYGAGFHIEGEIKGDFSMPTIRATGTAPTFCWRNVQVEDMECRFSFYNRKISIDPLSMSVNNAHLTATGYVDLSDLSCPSGEIELESETVRLSELLEDERFQGAIKLHVDAKGSLKKPVIQARIFHTDSQIAGIRLPSLECTAWFRDSRLHIELSDPEDQFQLTTSFDHFPNRPIIDGVLTLRAFSISEAYQQFFPHAEQRNLQGDLSGRLHVVGDIFSPTLSGAIKVADNPHITGAIRLEGKAHIPDSLRLSLFTDSLRIAGQPYAVSTRLQTDQQGMTVEYFGDGRYFDGSCFIAFDSTKSIRGEVNIQSVDMETLAEIFHPTPLTATIKGNLSGRFAIDGTLDLPYATASLRLDNGHFRRLDSISMTMNAHYENRDIFLDRLILRQDGRKIVHAYGYRKNDASNLAGLTIDRMDARLLSAIIGKPVKFSGMIDRLDLIYRHADQDPILYGAFSVSNGTIDTFDFYELKGKILGDRHTVQARDIKLSSHNGYSIKVNGRLPLQLTPDGQIRSESRVDLYVEAEGDLPLLLPRVVSKEISYGSGYVRAFVHAVGDLEEIILKDGYAEFRDCMVHPLLLVNEIKNINGIAIVSDNRITVKEAVAEVLGAKLQITSSHDPAIDFPHFELAGLDWGVLQFSTPDQGVEIHIPKLILERERGKFWVQGNNYSSAVFGGSFKKKPYLDALFIIDDISFTWPTLDVDPVPKEHRGKPSFAARADWNVKIKPKRNVWYTNDFATLLMDETSELWFTGCYVDSTLSIGGVTSAKVGTFEYIQEEFQAEDIVVKFNPYELFPYVYGRAVRVSESDSKIYLYIYSVDPATGEATEGGQFYNVRFTLRSDRSSDDTVQEILSRLHHDVDYETLTDEQRMEQNREEAVSALGYHVGKMMLRPVFRSVEETVRRAFQLDFVTFKPGLLKNLFDEMQRDQVSIPQSARSILLNRSKMSLGKYVTEQWYINYILTVEQKDKEYDPMTIGKLGLKQEFFLEYHLTGNTKFKYWYHRSREDQWQKVGFEKTFYF
ncbi:MAG: hypothetical protein B6244_10045 [Candidatus Cloacimonetes bacterium 4572_55]|nr:MAG: hypothetical protein B6244_10045 [Candidatus Cloacimonetes bacterium 4572_55]